MWSSVVRVANFNKELLRRMLADIPAADMCKQPPGLPNHPTWLVGHLTYVRFMVTKQAGAPDKFPEAWIPLFGRGSTPTAEPAGYPAKDELWGQFERLHHQAFKVASALTPEQLAGGHSVDLLKPAFPTLGDLLVQMLTAHDGLHIGQLSDWRRANGLPRLIP